MWLLSVVVHSLVKAAWLQSPVRSDLKQLRFFFFMIMKYLIQEGNELQCTHQAVSEKHDQYS